MTSLISKDYNKYISIGDTSIGSTSVHRIKGNIMKKYYVYLHACLVVLSVVVGGSMVMHVVDHQIATTITSITQ